MPPLSLPDDGADATWGVAAAVETTAGMRFVTIGSSFAVDEYRLVTNAHVIDAVLDLADGLDSEIMLVAVQHETGESRNILRMWKHPSFDPERFLSTPDLGVIEVDDSLPAVVQLADAARLERLSVFDGVALCGFAGDVSVDLGSARPRATCLPGSITALRPFDPNVPAAPANTLLIQHDIPTSKGTSGSAIFDAFGHVVAVNNAATVDDGASNRFAIRADLVSLFLADIDAGRVPAITIVRTDAPPPVDEAETTPDSKPPSGCASFAYRNDEFGFGFNPPPHFSGPVSFVDGRAVPGLLLSLAFPFDEFLSMDVTVMQTDGLLEDWLSEWTAIQEDAGPSLVQSEALTLPSGVAATILTWRVPRSFGRLTTIEFWAVRDGLRFGFSTTLTAADTTAIGKSVVDSYRSICMD